mgnify:FL=1
MLKIDEIRISKNTFINIFIMGTSKNSKFQGVRNFKTTVYHCK